MTASVDRAKVSIDEAVKIVRFTDAESSLAKVRDHARELAGYMRMLSGLEAPMRIAKEYYDLGVTIEGVAEKILGIRDAVAEATAALESEGKSRAAILASQVKDAQKQLLDGGFIDQWKRMGKAIDDALFGTDEVAEYDLRSQKKISKLVVSLNEAMASERQAAAQREAQKNEIAMLEGVEKIEAKRAAAIRAAREKYKDAAGVVVDSINKGADEEIRKFNETEEKKAAIERERERKNQERELADIEERSRAYNELILKQQLKERERIEKQERAEMESRERIARHAAETTARAMANIANQYNEMFDIKKMTMTLEALNANMKALTLKRQGN
jgi:hypothetical protein